MLLHLGDVREEQADVRAALLLLGGKGDGESKSGEQSFFNLCTSISECTTLSEQPCMIHIGGETLQVSRDH